MIDSDEPSDVAIAQKCTISCFDISCGNVTSRFIVVRVERWSEICMGRLNNDSLFAHRTDHRMPWASPCVMSAFPVIVAEFVIMELSAVEVNREG